MDIVTDHRSNANDQIERAVNVLGRSKDRLLVFNAIYKGKQKVKSVVEIARLTGLREKRVLEEGVKLRKNGIVSQVKVGSLTAYEKDAFYCANKAKILRIVESPSKLAKLPTKTRPQATPSVVKLSIPRSSVRSKQITIDDIDSFAAVRKVRNKAGGQFTKMLEASFKQGIKELLREESSFKDWGGETNDLLSTNVKYKGKRIATAFAFKGRGKTGKLTPAKMGKNGDQIQRLFQTPAELFIVQYWGEIDQSVIEQVQVFATVASLHRNQTIYFCIIDGQDSNRILEAYKDKFDFS